MSAPEISSSTRDERLAFIKEEFRFEVKDPEGKVIERHQVK